MTLLESLLDALTILSQLHLPESAATAEDGTHVDAGGYRRRCGSKTASEGLGP